MSCSPCPTYLSSLSLPWTSTYFPEKVTLQFSYFIIYLSIYLSNHLPLTVSLGTIICITLIRLEFLQGKIYALLIFVASVLAECLHKHGVSVWWMNEQQVDSDVQMGFISHLSPSSTKMTKQKHNWKQMKRKKMLLLVNRKEWN